MLEFDGQALDPAIVLAQPMKPGLSMDMPSMLCQPGKFLIQTWKIKCHYGSSILKLCPNALECF